ncbi:t-SNARE, partial [Cynara cardunculus var. scolymus]
RPVVISYACLPLPFQLKRLQKPSGNHPTRLPHRIHRRSLPNFPTNGRLPIILSSDRRVIDYKMSETFEGYERKYCELSASLSKKCTSASLLDGGEDINASMFLQNSRVYGFTIAQDKYIYAIFILPASYVLKQKKQKISEVKAGIDEAESLIRKMDIEARSLPPNVKAVLLAKLREYKSDLNNLKNQRGRLLMSTERLNKSSDRVRDSRRTMLETEELGLHGVDDNISKSKKIMTNISRRMGRNKWIIGSMVVVLILAIILILYFKLK